MLYPGRIALVATFVLSLAAETRAEEAYTLRYKFKQGETLYWTVRHEATVRSTVRGTTKQAQTQSDSVKVWKVEEIDDRGRITFVHSVESVRMKHKLTGREEESFDSDSEEQPPLQFRDIAKDIGVPLNRVTIDPLGEAVEKKNLRKKGKENDNDGPMTVPLPGEPVAVGGEWKFTRIARVATTGGTFKKVKLQQRFKLRSVRNGVAEIHVETVILTPIHDASVKAQLVQSKTNGVVKFDIAAGRVVEQDLHVNEQVIGAPAGPTSSMQYSMKFTEKYHAVRPRVARKIE